MHPMIIGSILTLVVLALVGASLGALGGWLIALVTHKSIRGWVTRGALVGLLLGLIPACGLIYYYFEVCAFCM